MRSAVIAAAIAACSSPGNGGRTPDAAPSHDGAAADAPHTGSGGLHAVMGSNGSNGRIVDGSGATVRLHGADFSGTEYACLGGTIFDPGSVPADQTTLDEMTSWGINAVRVPLNEDCWLAINGAPAAAAGSAYRAAIRQWVSLLEQNGMYVIVDLHWAAPGSDLANGQLGMADADHAPTFWSQVAAAYAGDDGQVIFDLFNEPFISDWGCWLNGSACATDANGSAYMTAGMKTLLAAVRGAGADNLAILGGLGYSSEFTMWVDEVAQLPADSNVAVSWHTYSDQDEQTGCPSEYDGYSGTCVGGSATATAYGITAPLAAGYPVVVGEVGIPADSTNPPDYTVAQDQMLATWLDNLLAYLDGQGLSYLAWDWSLDSGPLLVTGSDGSPTMYFGQTYKTHLSAL
jgi:endoglucanase